VQVLPLSCGLKEQNTHRERITGVGIGGHLKTVVPRRGVECPALRETGEKSSDSLLSCPRRQVQRRVAVTVPTDEELPVQAQRLTDEAAVPVQRGDVDRRVEFGCPHRAEDFCVTTGHELPKFIHFPPGCCREQCSHHAHGGCCCCNPHLLVRSLR
jgi:hypothetical protein